MLPRLVVAGLSGESGKTIVSLSLLLAARQRGMPVRAFKKGPDYIDAAWLSWAAGQPARNLDTYLMGCTGVADSFARHALPGALNLVEGNRGLFDGVDARGTHSTAELAKAVDAPVVLVVNATKVTRTVAAFVLGCQRLDPDLRIASVVLNQVAGARHERILRESVETVCGIPVLGAIPRGAGPLLPSRHLGLVTPEEHPAEDGLARSLFDLTGGRLDVDRLLEIARQAPDLAAPPAAGPAPYSGGLTIGYLRDSAFTFYYPENLESLAAEARLEPISSQAARLPDGLDGLYIGGGFPETHAEALAANQTFLASLRAAADRGLPIYAECGGLMLLAQAIRWQGHRYPMAGVLPFEVEVCASHQGHGYVELLVDQPNPFFAVGTRIKGHEFHYSRIVPGCAGIDTACAVLRGTGCSGGRDAVLVGNVWASYTHLHAAATPEWAAGFLGAIRRRKDRAFLQENDPREMQSLPL